MRISDWSSDVCSSDRPAWVAELKAALPEAPSVRRRKLTTELGLSDLDSQAMVNAGVLDVVLATVEAGASATEARNWWLGHLAQAANTRGEIGRPSWRARVCQSG